MGSKTLQVKEAGSPSAPPRLTSARNAGWGRFPAGVGFCPWGLDQESQSARKGDKHRIFTGVAAGVAPQTQRIGGKKHDGRKQEEIPLVAVL